MIIAACALLEELELLACSSNLNIRLRNPAWDQTEKESLEALRRAANLRTLRLNLKTALEFPWNMLLAELAYLQSLRSLGAVYVNQGAATERLVHLNQITHLKDPPSL